MEFDNLREYLMVILRNRIKAKPFKREDIYEVHDELKDYHDKDYLNKSIRRKLWDLREEDIIRRIDHFPNDRSKDVFVFTEPYMDEGSEEEESSEEEVKGDSLKQIVEMFFKNWI